MLFALLLSLSLVHAQDATRVRAALSSQNVRVGESVTLTIVVESRSQSFRRGAEEPVLKPPRLPSGIQIIARQQSVQQSFSMPGGRTHTVRHDIAIVPSRAGRFAIPPIQAVVGGDTYESSALELVVSDAPLQLPDESGPSSGARLLLALTPDTVYAGQQLTLSVELLVNSETQLRVSRPPVFSPPAPTAFWVHDLPTSPAAELRIINGNNYHSYRGQRAYFPLTPGTYQFDPVEVTYTARQGFLMAPETRELALSPPPVTVIPLPEGGRPNGFGGAVGRYTMSVDVQPRSVAAGDAISLTVRVAGSGNIKTLPAPTLPAIDGMEVLSPSEVSETTLDGGLVGGKKLFTWVLVPQRAGRQQIPAIRFVYFDPDSRTYTELVSDPIEVRVTPGGVAERAAPEFSPLRLQRGGSSLGWVATRWFALAQIVPPLLVFGLILQRRRAPYAAVSRSRARCMRQLDALEKHLAASDIYDRIATFLRECISDTLGVDVRAATSANIGRYLAGVLSDAQVAEVTELLRELETTRYAARAAGGQERRELIARVRRFVRSLPIRPRSGYHAAVFAALLLLQQPAAFEHGVEAFQNGRVTEAVDAFRAYVDAHPGDASGWYNLGNAYARAGDRALATWAWLNTVALEPRARDAVRNLELVRAGPIIERVRPAARLSGTEVLLLCAAAWWTAWVVFCLATRRARRANVLIGLALLALAGGLTSARAIERVLPSAAVVHGTAVQGRVEPNRRAEAALALTRGTTVVIVQERPDWLLVESTDGQQAWVERGAVLPVARPRL